MERAPNESKAESVDPQRLGSAAHPAVGNIANSKGHRRRVLRAMSHGVAQDGSFRAGGEVKRPGKKVLRGLEWVRQMAEADYETASGDKGVGHFHSATRKEVELALSWLAELIRSSEGRRA
jgi:hypothetical protein